MTQNTVRPDYIFEVSWEVCNKVGGIHTVITSKTLTLVNEWEDHLIMIGPDTWKGTGEHPEFTEDKSLFTTWHQYAEQLGLKIKIGRWKITGYPIAVLVDFTPFFTNKDDVFRDLWINYKVDSLTGGWDYIEPALFGYAAGKVIESFYHHYLTFSDKIVAQFHEWITGVGLLYLNEHLPQAATVFTTHATTVGRSIAGNGLPLYSKFNTYNADQEARSLNVIAKHSLEKMAAMNADCFTTVSDITSKECVQFLEKKPDVITPNGFEDFFVPYSFFFKEKRTLARKKLIQVAEALLGYELPKESLLVLKSGRYEFRNKGIDLFIDSLGELSKNKELSKNIVAFICIPAHTTGPRKDLMEKMEDKNHDPLNASNLLTHNLQGAESDPILNRIEQNNLDNSKEKKVKVIFVPVYLNGRDGIFNMHYYDLLVGFDLSAFPSYYEPWGYTPLESLAFHIPTITTNLTGFGMIVHSSSTNISQGISVIDRNDSNEQETVKKIASIIKEYSEKNEQEIKIAREAAFQLSKSALWKNFIEHYKKAYEIALIKADGRADRFTHKTMTPVINFTGEATIPETEKPVWRKIFVQSQIPENLKTLEKIARNLWWTWNTDAIKLFSSIDEPLWSQSNHNPIVLIDSLSYIQIKRLEKNKDFLDNLNRINNQFEEYIQRPFTSPIQIAYFCMEYGLCANLKLYSGGLGILAGDILKEASDTGTNIIGLGLLYRKGYFRQEISESGEQIPEDDIQKFTSLPLIPVYNADGSWMKISIAFPGRTLYAKAWKVEVGKSSLYLLDSDIQENRMEDKNITSKLYGGNLENRLKQELLLGIGGVRLLKMLNINPDIYHYNEGHAAFAGLERLLILAQEKNLSFEEALEVVRSSSLFTTHTPVPAGHDNFSEEFLRVYLSHYTTLLNINWRQLMSLGCEHENKINENFSMSYFAARLSQEMNGVSKIHEKVSRKIFGGLWKGYSTEELHIQHVTNGVHYYTWCSEEWQQLYKNAQGENSKNKDQKSYVWKKIQEVEDKKIWEVHLKHKKRLIDHLQKTIKNNPFAHHKKAHQTSHQIENLNENTLIIGFAKRFVTYKRPLLIFQDINRLSSILKKSKFPILFLFSGKAHPKDRPGNDIIKQIIELSAEKQFSNAILYLTNYDIEVAKYLTQGSDLWLNTPDSEMEASGTSGMKAALNGVLNFSMSDGWWAETYNTHIGWAIPAGNRDNYTQNKIDAERLYDILENEIIPLYNNRNGEEIPQQWVHKIKNSIEQIAPHYTAGRMLDEYTEKFYTKLNDRSKSLCENDFETAKKIAAWKKKIKNAWSKISILSTELYDSTNKAFPLGSKLTPQIKININELSADDIGVEIVFINKRKEEADFIEIISKTELIPGSLQNGELTFTCEIPVTRSGVFEYGFRIFPKNKLLPHRQDFSLLKWI